MSQAVDTVELPSSHGGDLALAYFKTFFEVFFQRIQEWIECSICSYHHPLIIWYFLRTLYYAYGVVRDGTINQNSNLSNTIEVLIKIALFTFVHFFKLCYMMMVDHPSNIFTNFIHSLVCMIYYTRKGLFTCEPIKMATLIFLLLNQFFSCKSVFESLNHSISKNRVSTGIFLWLAICHVICNLLEILILYRTDYFSLNMASESFAILIVHLSMYSRNYNSFNSNNSYKNVPAIICFILVDICLGISYNRKLFSSDGIDQVATQSSLDRFSLFEGGIDCIITSHVPYSDFIFSSKFQRYSVLSMWLRGLFLIYEGLKPILPLIYEFIKYIISMCFKNLFLLYKNHIIFCFN